MVTGVSGSGKTTMVLESLIPALEAAWRAKLPEHVKVRRRPGIRQVKLIDATPIGINVRSTVATYANVHDELRKVYARTQDAKEKGLQGGGFLLQYGKAPLPCLRRHRQHQPGRAVPAGCGHSLPGLRRLPLREGGLADPQ